jgi:4-amino-4-deoxy-L-arabinose transferase-like glycosyltransferase
MLGLVPVLCFVVLVIAYAASSSERDAPTPWRAAFLAAAVTWGLTVTAVTETLSLIRLLTFGWLLTLWLGALLVAAVLCAKTARRGNVALLLERPSLPRFELWCVVSVVTLASLVALVALAAPPNNADSMSYHMPRVMHWAQNHTVAHYPTNILRQILRPPWSGFAMVQFQILTGGDHWANLVQWFSMVGSVVGVSLIAGRLGADTRGQALAAVLAATIPMGILQASSTQNYYVTAFWLVCFVYYALRFMAEPRWADTLGVGASLGLALLTKEFSYMYAAPLLVWFSLAALRRQRWRAVPPLLVIAAITIGVNLGHYARNIDLAGVPFVIEEDDRRGVNTVFGVRTTLSNVVRNASLHVGTPSGRLNRWLYEGVRLFHATLGIDASDPRTTDAGQWGFHQRPFSRNDDGAGNPIHLALILVALGLLVAGRERRAARDVGAYAICLVIGFLIFCSYLKWALWHSRIHLPLFVLWTPLLSVVVLRRARPPIVLSIVTLLLATSTVYVFGNELRPLVGIGPNSTVFNTSRVDQIFKQFGAVKPAYLAGTHFVAALGCSEVGLDTGLEYPVWVLLRNAAHRPFRIDHAFVTNLSAARSTADPFVGLAPCAVLVDSSCEPPCSPREADKEALFEGRPFTKAWSSGRVAVFVTRDLSRRAEDRWSRRPAGSDVVGQPLVASGGIPSSLVTSADDGMTSLARPPRVSSCSDGPG